MNTRKFLMALLAACLIAASLGFVQAVHAADGIAIVDQENTSFPRLYNCIQAYSPIGQSFTPTMPGLDKLELMTADFTYYDGYGAELYVHIRQSTVYGPIIGTSHITALPSDFHGVTSFTFPSLVPLVPGQVYVIEVLVVGDQEWNIYHYWGVGSPGGPDSTYLGGTWILNGEEVPNNDLWFREGLANTTPQTAAYCKNKLWSQLYRMDGSRFKNQGDCMQFVRTGR